MLARHLLRAWLPALALGVGACGGGGPVVGDAGALVCTADAVTSCPADGPTFETVHPIITSRCTPCHSGLVTDGPWPLRTYDEIVSWSDDVRTMLLSCEMPPFDGGILISDEDRKTILTWIRCDLPR